MNTGLTICARTFGMETAVWVASVAHVAQIGSRLDSCIKNFHSGAVSWGMT